MQVFIIMGSDSDLSLMSGCAPIFEEFSVSHRFFIASAHRNLTRTLEIVDEAEKDGVKVIIAGAGGAAALAGVIAAKTIIPVLAIPVPTPHLHGVDSLYSSVQMPGGVPVAAMAIGKGGVKNAALFAVSIIGTADPVIREKYIAYKKSMSDTVLAKDKKLQELGVPAYLKEMNK